MLRHLKETKQEYVDHFIFAFVSGLTLLYAGALSIIHAFIPDAFPFKSEMIIADLTKKANRRRLERNNV